MRPIKICFFSLYAYPYFNPASAAGCGGAELQLYYLATELAKDPRFSVDFIVGDFGQPALELRSGVKLHKFSNPYAGVRYWGGVGGVFSLWRFLRKIDADLYIQRAQSLETGVIALFAKLYRKKFIYMVACDADLKKERPAWVPKSAKGLLRWRLFRLGVALADLVVVQNKEQKEKLRENYRKEGLLRMSAHPIPDEVPVTEKEFVLWVARGDKWKQPELFLRLARLFPKERFVMIMPEANDKEYRRKVRTEAKTIPNLTFLDFVPFHQIDAYFLRAKVFVNTSSAEGFPNTFVQAAKNKTPILSLHANPSGILEKYKMGRCCSGDFQKMIDSLKEILEDAALRKKMGENAFAYAKEHHSLKKIIEEDKGSIRALGESKAR